MSTRNYISMQQKYNRVIVLVDMDCFFCQVEEKLDPQLKGQPLAVVQYNAWRGGGIIAVNYAARAKGVTRHMRGDEAKEKCPEIQLVKVPNIREKADLDKYREAGKEVANVLQRFTPLLERASVDEAYLDITEAVNKRLGDMNAGSFMLQPQGLVNTYAVGYAGIGEYVNLITNRFNNPNTEDIDLESGAFAQAHDAADMAATRHSDIRLLIGAAIAGEVRAAVKAETGYECSAGIAHNKILAKLACGINKPNKQTILPLTQIPVLFETLPLGKIRGLGGKFGEEICANLQIRFLGELLPYSEQDLQRKFDEKSGTWLYNICRGIDLEAVTPRFYSKSIGCCKKFPGRNNITGLNTLRHWLSELANEVCNRMEKDMIENNRRAKQMVVSFVQEFDNEEVSSSRSAPLNGYDKETLTKCSLDVIQSHTKQFFKTGNTLALNNPIKFLSISVGKFETIQSGQSKLQEMFANMAAKRKNESEDTLIQTRYVNNGKDTQDQVELPVAKKPTFMENFLRRGCEQNANTATNTNSDAAMITAESGEKATCTTNVQFNTNTTDSGNVTAIQSTINNTMKTTQSPEKNSFFLNALKKQMITEGECKPNEPKKTDISKSFFAKILKNSKDEINLTEIATPSNLQISSEDACNTTTFQSSVDDVEQSVAEMPQINEQAFETGRVVTTESPSKSNENVGLSRNKRKYATVITNPSPPHALHLSNIPVNSKHTPSETYETSYAEFAVPELRTEFLQMTKCEICKVEVPSDARSIQLHQDHHIAMQLSQQLRQEYRTEIKTQLTANKSTSTAAVPKKKSKKSPVQATKVAGGKIGTSITKFLKPNVVGAATSSNVSESVAASEHAAAPINILDDTVDAVICEECKAPIINTELQEHKDFHVAKALQRQLNMLEVRTVSLVKPNTACNSALNTTHSSIKNSKPITQFFSQSNC
ncbi:DNA polymerase eta [Anastrepha obliqua]|uniref:DNA polymerase eta n=1 Tax=Anastrepha obliqua TaxID=95512 RepID=UPI00240A1CBA|nr:DNA polymerase eta [Anastrepha obliqua]